MSGSFMLISYLIAAALAVVVLALFRAKKWYWHVISLLLALLVGLTRPPAGWSGPVFDLVVGCLFCFLFVWAVAAPLFRKSRPRGLSERS